MVDSLVIHNQNLHTLEGLENLATITQLVIENMPNLITLEHLGANTASDYRTSVHSIGIHNNPMLTNLDGLRIVENVTSKIMQSMNKGSRHSIKIMNGRDQL